MRISSVRLNNRRKAFEVRVRKGTFLMPFARTDPQPDSKDRVVRVTVDKELGGEGFTYQLQSGREGTVHVDHVLEYNRDPSYMRDLLLYKLTLEAQRRIKTSRLSKREIIRRLRTSATQFYRLMDQTNYRKSVDQLLSLLQVLDCDVDLVVKPRGKAA